MYSAKSDEVSNCNCIAKEERKKSDALEERELKFFVKEENDEESDKDDEEKGKICCKGHIMKQEVEGAGEEVPSRCLEEEVGESSIPIRAVNVKAASVEEEELCHV